MRNKEDLKLIKEKRLKLKDFVFGIIIGIVLSVLSGAIFNLLDKTNKNLMRIIILFSVILLGVVYRIYKRSYSIPDLFEYKLQFTKNNKCSWDEVGDNIRIPLKKELKKEYFNMDFKVLRNIWKRYFKYNDRWLTSSWFGNENAIYIYNNKNEATYILLLENSSFGDSIFINLEKILNHLVDIKIIKRYWKIQKTGHYRYSLLTFFFVIKGKPVKED